MHHTQYLDVYQHLRPWIINFFSNYSEKLLSCPRRMAKYRGCKETISNEGATAYNMIAKLYRVTNASCPVIELYIGCIQDGTYIGYL